MRRETRRMQMPTGAMRKDEVEVYYHNEAQALLVAPLAGAKMPYPRSPCCSLERRWVLGSAHDHLRPHWSRYTGSTQEVEGAFVGRR